MKTVLASITVFDSVVREGSEIKDYSAQIPQTNRISIGNKSGIYSLVVQATNEKGKMLCFKDSGQLCPIYIANKKSMRRIVADCNKRGLTLKRIPKPKEASMSAYIEQTYTEYFYIFDNNRDK